MAKILVCTPVALGLPRVEYSLALAGTTLSLAKAGHARGVYVGREWVHRAEPEHGIGGDHERSTCSTLLVFIDADMAWEPVDVIMT